MTLLALLIEKDGLAQLATATHATVATLQQNNQITVAKVATVAVAEYPESLIDGDATPFIYPTSVQCLSCQHFKRDRHPHLGQCVVGEIGTAGGFWDSDWRYCQSYFKWFNN